MEINPIIQRLIRGNGAFIEDHYATVERHMLAEQGQEPQILIITCSDSRVIPEKIFSLSLGEALIIRNAGARITEDVLKDVEFFTSEFESLELVVLMGHSKCGYYGHAVAKGIDVEPTLLESLRNEMSEPEVVDHLARMEVVEGVQKLRKVVPSRINLHGAFYNIESGIVDF
ncbi:MAG: carbonic anhydrase [Ignavibacteriales bacterium]